MGLTAFIVDDEPAAVRRLQSLLADDERLDVIGTANDGHSALRVIGDRAPSLVFLDIEMPGMDGIAVAEAVSEKMPKTRIIFVTAHDSFALKAFDVSAAGYILKPIDPQKLSKAIDEVLRKPICEFVSQEPALWVTAHGKLQRLPPEMIVRVQAERDYVRIFTEDRSYLMACTLNRLVEDLANRGFVRVHRGHAIKLSLVDSLAHKGGGAWEVVLLDGTAIPIGRTHLNSVRERLGV